MEFLNKDSNAGDLVDPSPFHMNNTVDPGTKTSHGFLQKLFPRPRNIPRLAIKSFEHETILSTFEGTNDLDLIDAEVAPCPYIYPLGKRLEPRIESAPTAPRLAVKPKGRSASSKREESRNTHNYLSLREMGENLSSRLAGSVEKSVRSLMLRDELAVAIAANASQLKEWDNYLKCYSEGRYSMTVPPYPPPRSSSFTYLPSTYPPNEIERLATFQSSQIWSGTSIEWSKWEDECARSLIIAAAKKFATSGAAISFFDRDNEIIQAERGYRRHFVPRHESIASHVLLTDEVMTVLDTRKVIFQPKFLEINTEVKQDWRFQGNPLVLEGPKIRFFAGAPLLSTNGQVVGVFAIFSSEARANFAAVQKHDLIDLGKIATSQLVAIGSLSPGRSLRDFSVQRPLMYDESNPDPTKSSTNARPAFRIEPPMDSSTSLRYHKASHNGISRPRLIINSESRGTYITSGTHTPPISDDSDAGTSPILLEFNGLPKISRPWLHAGLTDHPPDVEKAWKSESFEPFEPGALSVCDIEGVNSKSNSPRMTFKSKNDTKEIGERFRSCMDLSSDDAADLLTLHPDSPAGHVTSFSSFSVDSEEREALLGEAILLDEQFNTKTRSRNELVSPSASAIRDASTCSSNFGDGYYHERSDMGSVDASDLASQKLYRSVDVQAEARFAAELWAKNLEFDAIYAIELISKSNADGQFELLSPEDTATRVHVSYGLPNSTNFDIPIHLDVLHGSGAVTWENKNSTPNEYSRGFMMPLIFRNGSLDCRSSGVVFGAFRRRAEKFKSAEVERLQRAAKALKQILGKSPSLKWSNPDEAAQLPTLDPQTISCI